jgi:hypothetical protein
MEGIFRMTGNLEVILGSREQALALIERHLGSSSRIGTEKRASRHR